MGRKSDLPWIPFGGILASLSDEALDAAPEALWQGVTTQQKSTEVYTETSVLFLRFLAESNRRKRFCRPVPNHSAKEPYAVVCACKVTKNLLHTQLHPFL